MNAVLEGKIERMANFVQHKREKCFKEGRVVLWLSRIGQTKVW